MTGTKPQLSSYQPAWLSELVVKEGNEPFETLPMVSQHAQPIDIQTRARNDLGIELSIREIGNDTFPLPVTKDREFYFGDDHVGYWLSGKSDVAKMRAASALHGISLDECRYFELGCSSGRVVRHLGANSEAEIWCADLNMRHAEWVRMYLPERLRVFANTKLPNLPMDSSSIDFVAAFSVFTHIDDFEAAWLAELRRLLRPGGIAYVTVMSEHTWESYKGDWIERNYLPMREQIKDYQINAQLFRGPLPNDKTVFWWDTGHAYNSAVFHHTRHIKREWGRFFEVVEIIPNGHVYQDVVILRRT